MSEPLEVPRFLAAPENIWVKCEEVRKLSSVEAGCVVSGLENEELLLFVDLIHCDFENSLIRALKVATRRSNPSHWLVQFPNQDGERLMMSEEMVANGNPV